MTQFYIVEPEVPGGLGERTVIDYSSRGTPIRSLHFVFEGWMGDELVTSTPCFLVTERLAAEIQRQGLSGVSFDSVEVTVSPEFEELQPDCKLPVWLWLRVCGKPGEDDFALHDDIDLVVSDRALQLLKHTGIAHAGVVSPYLPMGS